MAVRDDRAIMTAQLQVIETARVLVAARDRAAKGESVNLAGYIDDLGWALKALDNTVVRVADRIQAKQRKARR